jgi:hypothetical protein
VRWRFDVCDGQPSLGSKNRTGKDGVAPLTRAVSRSSRGRGGQATRGIGKAAPAFGWIWMVGTLDLSMCRRSQPSAIWPYHRGF